MAGLTMRKNSFDEDSEAGSVKSTVTTPAKTTPNFLVRNWGVISFGTLMALGFAALALSVFFPPVALIAFLQVVAATPVFAWAGSAATGLVTAISAVIVGAISAGLAKGAIYVTGNDQDADSDNDDEEQHEDEEQHDNNGLGSPRSFQSSSSLLNMKLQSKSGSKEFVEDQEQLFEDEVDPLLQSRHGAPLVSMTPPLHVSPSSSPALSPKVKVVKVEDTEQHEDDEEERLLTRSRSGSR